MTFSVGSPIQSKETKTSTAWCNGAFFVITIALFVIFLKSLWNHNVDSAIFSAIWTVAFGTAWVATLIKILKD